MSSVLFFQNLGMAKDYFISVGFKLGYIWGKGGGSSNGGIEASIVYWGDEDHKWYPYGFVLGWDAIPHLKSTKLHLGIEKNTDIGSEKNLPLVGVDVGPTLLFGQNNKLGFSIITYAGFIVIPYANLSFFKALTTQEIGAYIKLPVRTNVNLGFDD